MPVRRVWQVIDLTLATLRGEVRFGLMTDPRGFDAIDDYDCREWLLLNGASESSVDSGFLRALYDLGFAYEDGEPTRPRISAGQALRSMVRVVLHVSRRVLLEDAGAAWATSCSRRSTRS